MLEFDYDKSRKDKDYQRLKMRECELWKNVWDSKNKMNKIEVKKGW